MNAYIASQVNATQLNVQWSFLNCRLIVNNTNRLIMRTNRQPMHSDRYLNFYSAHAQCVKLALISTLTRRVDKLCNDNVTRKREIQHLHAVLRDNGYLPVLIDHALRGRLPTLDKNDTNSIFC